MLVKIDTRDANNETWINPLHVESIVVNAHSGDAEITMASGKKHTVDASKAEIQTRTKIITALSGLVLGK